MIKGYYGCSCHPFASWKACDAAHKQKLQVGQVVLGRCHGRQGMVHEATDRQGFCLVQYGPRPCDIHLEHAANLAPSSLQLSIF